jgi:hypothetical protein
MDLVRTDKLELAEAILKAQEEAQARQAPAVDPVEAGAPEAMPGLQAGVGQEAGVAADAAPSTAGLAALLGQLRSGQRATPQEAAFGQSTVGAA